MTILDRKEFLTVMHEGHKMTFQLLKLKSSKKKDLFVVIEKNSGQTASGPTIQQALEAFRHEKIL